MLCASPPVVVMFVMLSNAMLLVEYLHVAYSFVVTDNVTVEPDVEELIAVTDGARVSFTVRFDTKSLPLFPTRSYATAVMLYVPLLDTLNLTVQEVLVVVVEFTRSPVLL